MTLADYGRYHTPGTVYITCETFGREAILIDEVTVHLLRTVLKRVKRVHPFHTLGYVFLPDHLHLLLKPGENVTVDEIVNGVIARFTDDYQHMMGIPAKMVLWQQHCRMHRVEDEGSFAAHLDYIHYNPVYHGVAARPEEWLPSSYQVWVERGLYKLGWGWTLPNSIEGKEWE